MTAVDDLIVQLRASKYSSNPQNVVCDIDNLVAALQQLAAGGGALGPYLAALNVQAFPPGGDGFQRVNAVGTVQIDPLLTIFTAIASGLVPASGGGAVNFLRADGSWDPPPFPGIFSSVAAGLVPASGGGTANFQRADGTWAVPPGTGGGGAIRKSYQVGNWYWGFDGTIAAGSVLAANTIAWLPYFVEEACTLDALGARITTLAAGGNIQFAAYASGANGLATGSALGSSGNVSTAATGNVPGALTAVIPAPGIVWFGVNSDNSTVVLTAPSGADTTVGFTIGANSQAMLSPAAANAFTSYTTAQPFGTWPTNPVMAVAAPNTAAKFAPMFQIGSIP